MSLDVPVIWASLIAFAVFAYVVMDGADLGVGILFGFVAGRAERDVMVNSIAPVWDGNETWLVFGGGGLFAVFPLAYATLLPAFYMPLIAMLLALVFRGVAFEMRFRARTVPGRRRWDASFRWGSVAAALAQGIVLGAYVQGVHVVGRRYAGGWWDWLTPFSLLTGASLVIGYALLGASWLFRKTDGPLQDRFRQLAARLAVATLLLMGIVSIAMLATSAPFRGRWLSWPDGAFAAIVPILTTLLAHRFFRSLRQGWDLTPFLCALGFFLLAYVGLAISTWPMMVPPDISIWDAAAPPSTQTFLLMGASILVPVILGYTGFVYWIFRGKVPHDAGYH